MIKKLRFIAPLILLLVLVINFAERTIQLSKTNQLAEAKKISEEKAIKTQIINWQRVTNDWPNYRDGDIKLAILNWRLYRVFDAKKFLGSALKIDPNNELARKLLVLVQ